MTINKVEICVYGAEVLCPSCVNLPSSKETYEWLEAAITRKFPDQPFTITYIDIANPPVDDAEKRLFSERVIKEDMFYPVVVIEGEIVGEGNPKLKVISDQLKKYGYQTNKDG